MKYSILFFMRKPIKLRTLSTEEQQALEVGLRSTSSFTLRRCQVLLASQRGQTARQIADYLRCADQTVRNIIHAFNHAVLPFSLTPRRLGIGLMRFLMRAAADNSVISCIKAPAALVVRAASGL